MTSIRGGSPELRIGQATVTYSQRGVPTYRVELWHEGLNKHRVIRAADENELERKATLQATEWETRWLEIRSREDAKELAVQRSSEAQQQIKALEDTLLYALSSDPRPDWETLKDKSPFPKPAPTEPQRPANPVEPEREHPRYIVKPTIFELVFSPSRRQRKREASIDLWRTAHEEWARMVGELDDGYKKAVAEFDQARVDWDEEKRSYIEAQRKQHAEVDRHRENYREGEPGSVATFVDLVLSKSRYPDWMPREFEAEYQRENGTLIVSYSLPALEALPRLREVAFVASRGEMREKNMTDAQARALYDTVIYQVVLRTVHEVFLADNVRVVRSVVFNGYVTATDPATGKLSTTCIVSLHVTRDEFESIDLAKVDPKACFKALKGVGSSKLHSLAAVAPILEIHRQDSRFVSSRDVAESLDDSVNLAAMDWEEFEHLTRELFEAEFRSSGGEVKVTQSSRDGGVDAVAFDPDPIRGGKIVIQAKRYTNTVGVGAVRDLYGTVMNEGATKGILVTTSDYGPDAYRFAKDKPLTLMNGANLLHLLEKHGHRARIDLAAAKSD